MFVFIFMKWVIVERLFKNLPLNLSLLSHDTVFSPYMYLQRTIFLPVVFSEQGFRKSSNFTCIKKVLNFLLVFVFFGLHDAVFLTLCSDITPERLVRLYGMQGVKMPFPLCYGSIAHSYWPLLLNFFFYLWISDFFATVLSSLVRTKFQPRAGWVQMSAVMGKCWPVPGKEVISAIKLFLQPSAGRYTFPWHKFPWIPAKLI